MNKNVLLLGMTSILAVGTVAAVALTTNGSLLSQGLKADDNYSITIEPEDIVATHQDEWQSGFADLKTDQLHNDISFVYINANHNGEGDGLYLQGNGYGYISNDIGNEVRSIESILVKGANDSVTVRWGFRDGSNIYYVGDEWASATPAGYSFTLNGDEPNYFKIESGQLADTLLYQIVITYSSSCVEHANPYRVVNGIKYHRAGNEWSVVGFDGASSANVVIEETIDGDPVTDILAYAFYRDTTIASISLPKTIEQISQDAFRECISLASVTFASGGTEDLYIYDGAFRDSGLTSFTVPTRTEYIESPYAFMDVENLVEFAIENDDDTGKYRVADGVLYEYKNSDVNLMYYPISSPYTTFNVPSYVTKINSYACQNTKYINTLIFNNDSDLYLDAYCFGNVNDNSPITTIAFNGSGTTTLFWNPFRGYKHDLVLHSDTILEARALGQLGENARVFLEADSIQGNWDAEWATSKTLTSNTVKFYLFSESEPAGVTPTNIDGFWHYVGYDPTIW